MKTLIFFRHGKSDWEAEYGQDRDRPLAKRGKRASRRMGAFLAANGPLPDAILTSPAVRARETLRLAMEKGKWEAPVSVEDALYESTPGDVLAVVSRQAESSDVLLLVGHEPTWSTTISILIGGGCVGVPTGAMARVDLEIDRWSDLSEGAGCLAWLIPPRKKLK